ncbi:MAG: TrbG/VirB9 family P-type conjugative transfer protein [Steroidobacteraceae bacterium]
MMSIVFAGVGLSYAETLPPKGKVDSRIREVPYKENEVYRLVGFVGYAIELVFDEGEVFAGNGGGDLEGIAFGWHDNQLILKPKAANVGTNLVVYTNKRAYRFDYTVSARRPNVQSDEVMYTVRFKYPPQPTVAGLSEAQQTELNLQQATHSRSQNVDYWYCGAPSLKPLAASDDGVHTRLQFASRAELPAIFVRNADDSESLLNFSMEEGEVVIHRVAARFILRRGTLTGCVVNQGVGGSGERLTSGTLSPQVQRQRKAGVP